MPVREATVVSRSVLYWPTVAVSILLGGLFSGAAGYWLGADMRAGEEVDLAALIEANRVSRDQLREVSRLLADTRLADAVDRGASEDMRDTVRQLRNQVAALERQVGLYRRMLEPGAAPGLSIDRLQVLRTGDSARYRVVLMQGANAEDWSEGTLRVEVEGATEAGPRTLEADTPEFRFRYFQEIERDIAIPAGFRPGRVLVSAEPADAELVVAEVAWPEDAG